VEVRVFSGALVKASLGGAPRRSGRATTQRVVLPTGGYRLMMKRTFAGLPVMPFADGVAISVYLPGRPARGRAVRQSGEHHDGDVQHTEVTPAPHRAWMVPAV
jgi:hypothetical protein